MDFRTRENEIEIENHRIKRTRRFVLLHGEELEAYCKKIQRENEEKATSPTELLLLNDLVIFGSDVSLMNFIVDARFQRNCNVMTNIAFELMRKYVPLLETTDEIGRYIQEVIGLGTIMWNVHVKNELCKIAMTKFVDKDSFLMVHALEHTESLGKSMIEMLKNPAEDEVMSIGTSMDPIDMTRDSMIFCNIDGELIVSVDKSALMISCEKNVAEFILCVKNIASLLEIVREERNRGESYEEFELVDEVLDLVRKYMSVTENKKSLHEHEREMRTEITDTCQKSHLISNLMICGPRVLCDIMNALYDGSGKKCLALLDKPHLKQFKEYKKLSELRSDLFREISIGKTRHPKPKNETKRAGDRRRKIERAYGIAAYVSILLCAVQQRRFIPLPQDISNDSSITDCVPWNFIPSIVRKVEVNTLVNASKQMRQASPPVLKYLPIEFNESAASFKDEASLALCPISLRILIGVLAYNARDDLKNRVPFSELDEDTAYEKKHTPATDDLSLELKRIQRARNMGYAGVIVCGNTDRTIHIHCEMSKTSNGDMFSFGCFDSIGETDEERDSIMQGKAPRDAKYNNAHILYSRDVVTFYNCINQKLKLMDSVTVNTYFMKHHADVNAFMDKSPLYKFLDSCDAMTMNAIRAADGFDV